MKNPLAEANPVSQALYESEARRMVQLYALYDHLEDPNIGLPNIWVGKMLQRAETLALVSLLIQRGVIFPDEFLVSSANFLGAELESVEKKFNILITTDGVISKKKPKESSDGGQAREDGEPDRGC